MGKERDARMAVRAIANDQAKVDPTELALNFADIICGVEAAGLASLSDFVPGAAALKALISAQEKVELVPNVFFSLAKVDGGPSPKTAEYLRNRSWKDFGGSGLALVSVVASATTAGVNVISAVQEGNATGSTALHLNALRAIAEGEAAKRNSKAGEWLSIIIKMKTMKLGIRGAGLAGALIPAGSLGVSIATTIAKLGIKVSATKLCFATAAEVHYHAFQEQRVRPRSQEFRAAGPASAIMWEIFARRGATAVFGPYDVPALTREPAGWMALADKLTLI